MENKISNPKVTVIVPIYNTEIYIEQCVRSLLEQSLDSIEYLFIDDCSPDSSAEILSRVIEEYPNRKSQCMLYSMPSNSGLSAVRRHGIQHAQGDYIIHCDSDDWVDKNLYLSMYEAAVSNNADMVICDVMDEFCKKVFHEKAKI